MKPQAVNKILCDWKNQLTKIFSKHKTQIQQLLDGIEKAVQTLLIKHDQSIVNENIDFGVKIPKKK